MSAVLTLLRESGRVTIASSFAQGSTRGAFVRSIYNALSNGADHVTVLAQSAGSELIAAATEAATDDDPVITCDEVYSKGERKGQPKDAADVLAAIHRRNANNESASGDTYGAVSFVDPLYSGDTLVGFVVKRDK